MILHMFARDHLVIAAPPGQGDNGRPYEGLLLAEADTWFQHLSSTLQLLALGKKDPPFVSGEE